MDKKQNTGRMIKNSSNKDKNKGKQAEGLKGRGGNFVCGQATGQTDNISAMGQL